MKKYIATFILLLPLLAFAQEALPPLPSGKGEMWKFGIMFLTPLIVSGVKVLVPNIPKLLLPVSTPFVGLLLGLALKYLGMANLSWVDMGMAGGLAVLIYETVHQATTSSEKKRV